MVNFHQAIGELSVKMRNDECFCHFVQFPQKVKKDKHKNNSHFNQNNRSNWSLH
jgi:hypothetical protein